MEYLNSAAKHIIACVNTNTRTEIKTIDDLKKKYGSSYKINCMNCLYYGNCDEEDNFIGIITNNGTKLKYIRYKWTRNNYLIIAYVLEGNVIKIFKTINAI